MLVDLLDEDYSDQRDLVVHALNGIGSVFDLQVCSIPTRILPLVLIRDDRARRRKMTFVGCSFGRAFLIHSHPLY